MWETISMLLGVVLIVAVGIIVKINAKIKQHQRRKWNNGRCRCGTPWTEFANNKGLGKGFYCHNCENYLWITFGGIDCEPKRTTEKSL